MTELRPYQAEVIEQIERIIATGKRKLILVAPTGSGKTVIAAKLIGAYVARYKNVLVLAHRREIVWQTSQKLKDQDISHGVIQAGFDHLVRPFAFVQVASVQTLWSRAMRTELIERPAADLIVVDECHHATAMTWRKIIDAYPDAILIGLTATPCRGDGRGLGGIFDAIVECPQVQELVDQKYLVKTRVFAPVDPDLKGVKTQAGDYVISQLAERMNQADLVGDIVTHWHKYGDARRTVCFAVDVAHSVSIKDEFVNAGVAAEHIDGGTPRDVRDAILERLRAGETKVVSNCMVLTEGWDMPAVSCCILARPTKSVGLFRQMIGRILRPAENKHNAIVLDHSGAVFRHGFVEDPVEWTLDPESRAVSPAHKARQEGGYKSRLVDCQCGSIRIAGEACDHCGFLPKRRGEHVVFEAGDLGEVDRLGRQANGISDPNERLRWHAMLTYIRDEKNSRRPCSAGWIAHKYKEKFGMWPPWGSTPAPMEPSPEVRSWVRSRDIAYAKRLAA